VADRLFRVVWKAGEITLHASSQKQALLKAMEYIAQPEANRIAAELTGVAREIQDASIS